MVEDGPVPTVLEEKALVPRKLGGQSLIEIWTSGAAGAEEAERRLETFTKMLHTLRKHAIGQTYPEDWVIHSTINDGVVTAQVGYLQDIGCQRAGKIFGIEIHEPKCTKEDHQDGSYIYVFTSKAYSRVTHEFLDYVEGSRWSGDDFFQRAIENAKAKGDDLKLDPTDVRKAAYANLHGRGVRALGGLSAVPLEELTAAGVDVKRCRYVGYSAGSKGGAATSQTGGAELVMRFGRSAGVKVSELADKDLAWYVGAYERDLADPAKEKHKAANQRFLDALKAEQEKRAKGAAHEEATGTTGKAAAAGDGEPTGAGKKRGDLWALLEEVAGKKAVPVLKQVVKDQLGREISGLSEITEEKDLDALLKIPKAVYSQVAKALEDAKK